MMRWRKTATVLVLIAMLGGMTTLVSFAVPLYRMFCQATGFGGTTQTADGPADRILDRMMTVRFNADVDPALPWRFQPAQDAIHIRVGEPALAAFTARSLATAPITGTATFNVTPAKAGLYFVKTECFCFTEQVLAPGARADLPVSFFIDPAIADDRNLDEVTTVTLSYTFFRAVRQDGADGRHANAASAAPGRAQPN